MPEHAHITTIDAFQTKHQEMKDKWMAQTGTILVARCNHCHNKHGLHFYNNDQAWKDYNQPCSCGNTDKSIMTLTPKARPYWDED